MTSPSVVAPAKSGFHRDANWMLAVLATAGVLALHLYFLHYAGGLWRDEVNSLSLAQGRLGDITKDSFPVLFPLLLRGWSAIGLGGSDLAVRCFGVLMGLCLAAVFWLAARWVRGGPPLWSLILVALNAWVIYYGASLRAYGLGSAMIALCTAAAWRFVHNPGRKNWLMFAATAVLSVQTLYQNSVLVAAICAGACAVFLRHKKVTLCVAVFLAGLMALISLLPYWHSVVGMPTGAAPLRQDFIGGIALSELNTLVAFPLSQFFTVWEVLIGLVVLRAAVGLFSAPTDDRPLFAAVTMVCGVAAFWIFLRLANFPVQPWYFMPPVALVVVCLEASLPRPAGRFRALLWGGLAATAVMSAMIGVRLLNGHFTNVDQLAKRIAASAGEKDLVVVTPWQLGITFSRYCHNPGGWTTVPPMADHSSHRYDLLRLQMQNPDAMQPVLARVAATLRSGGAVWVLGLGIADEPGATPPSPPPPPPLRVSGWQETPYRIIWNAQLSWLLYHDSTNVECLDSGIHDDIRPECAALTKVSGWKNQAETPGGVSINR